MQATVTKNMCTQVDGAPRYHSSAAGTPCYVAGSLVLNANFLSVLAADNSHYTLTMDFNPGYSGTCNYAEFTMRDINADVSTGTFLDIVEISATDGNGNAITATAGNLSLPAGGGITSTIPGNTTRQVVGNSLKLLGHNNASETYDASRSSSTCNYTTVRVKPPDNVWLKTITIKYRPAYGSNSGITTYYNFNGPPRRPANQYISISGITLTPITCPTPLGVELNTFNGNNVDLRSNLLKWTTASEVNNSHFYLERSIDGEFWDHVATINGSGTTDHAQSYVQYDHDFDYKMNYYRLKQYDYDGSEFISEIILIDNSLKAKKITKIVNILGQEVDENFQGMRIIVYEDGSIVKYF